MGYQVIYTILLLDQVIVDIFLLALEKMYHSHSHQRNHNALLYIRSDLNHRPHKSNPLHTQRGLHRVIHLRILDKTHPNMFFHRLRL